MRNRTFIPKVFVNDIEKDSVDMAMILVIKSKIANIGNKYSDISLVSNSAVTNPNSLYC